MGEGDGGGGGQELFKSYVPSFLYDKDICSLLPFISLKLGNIFVNYLAVLVIKYLSRFINLIRRNNSWLSLTPFNILGTIREP